MSIAMKSGHQDYEGKHNAIVAEIFPAAFLQCGGKNVQRRQAGQETEYHSHEAGHEEIGEWNFIGLGVAQEAGKLVNDNRRSQHDR